VPSTKELNPTVFRRAAVFAGFHGDVAKVERPAPILIQELTFYKVTTEVIEWFFDKLLVNEIMLRLRI